MLNCLKQMEDWDPEGTKQAEEEIWEGFAVTAGVNLKTLRLALDRVIWDGYYGPVSDEEWEESDGRAMSLRDGLAICKAALGYEPDVKYFHPNVGYLCDGAELCDHPDHTDMGEKGPMWHEEAVRISPEQIKRECFASITKIYGSLF